MNKKIIISLVAASLAFPMYASAATNKQGGMYVRADVGYTKDNIKVEAINKTANKALDSVKFKMDGFAGSLGVGTYLTKETRLEAQVFLNNGLKGKKKNSSLTLHESTLIGFANVYYDMVNSSAVTPYVMGGIGISKNRLKLSNKLNTVKFDNKAAFAYQLGAGASFKANPNLDIDLGYRLMHKGHGKIKTKTATTTAGNQVELHSKRGFAHAFLAGVRVSF